MERASKFERGLYTGKNIFYRKSKDEKLALDSLP